ncbi:MAG: hypothetical protein ACK4SX_07010 [Alcanivoracaceae bacterium]
MSFNETLIFLAFLALFYNVYDYFRLRWVAKGERSETASNKEIFIFFLLLLAGLGFCIFSPWYAFVSAREAYPVTGAGLISLFYIVGAVVLIKKSVASVISFRVSRKASLEGD